MSQNLPQIIVVLHNIRSVYNVGAILRTCEGLGVTKAIFSGYTPRYDDANLLPHLREKLNRQIAKSALGAETLVPQTPIDDLPSWLAEQRRAGWTIIGLENNLSPAELERRWILGTPFPGANLNTPSSSTVPSLEKLILVLGEEVHGIPPELHSALDLFLEIPMQGRKESFNVSVATGIALWGLRQAAQTPNGQTPGI